MNHAWAVNQIESWGPDHARLSKDDRAIDARQGLMAAPGCGRRWAGR